MLAFGLSVIAVTAQSEINGERQGILTLSGSPYLATDDLIVPEGTELVIEAGVEIRFRDVNDGLIVDGTLTAIGQPDLKIRLTSDDTDFLG